MKIRLKHLKILKCQGQDFVVSHLAENDKGNLLWSGSFKILHLSLFLLEKTEVVEKKHTIITHVRRTLYYYRNE